MRVSFSRVFTAQLLLLEKVDARHIGTILDRLKASDLAVGKRLSGDLHNCFSVRVGLRHRLRIVYLVKAREAVILTVGQREGNAVYIQALQILKELEQ